MESGVLTICSLQSTARTRLWSLLATSCGPAAQRPYSPPWAAFSSTKGAFPSSREQWQRQQPRGLPLQKSSGMQSCLSPVTSGSEEGPTRGRRVYVRSCREKEAPSRPVMISSKSAKRGELYLTCPPTRPSLGFLGDEVGTGSPASSTSLRCATLRSRDADAFTARCARVVGCWCSWRGAGCPGAARLRGMGAVVSSLSFEFYLPPVACLPWYTPAFPSLSFFLYFSPFVSYAYFSLPASPVASLPFSTNTGKLILHWPRLLTCVWPASGAPHFRIMLKITISEILWTNHLQTPWRQRLCLCDLYPKHLLLSRWSAYVWPNMHYCEYDSLAARKEAEK